MIYWDVLASVWRFCNEFIEEMKGEGLSSDLAFINWDAHADIHELPATDLIGPATFAMDVDDRVHSVSCAVGLSTFNDKNMFRHAQIIASLYEALQPEKKLDVYDYSEGTVTSWMVLRNGTAVLPTTRSEVRPFQFVQFSALVSPAIGLQ